ncbi:MAG TPA: serine hydrolase [Acidimicrobiales bacterium]
MSEPAAEGAATDRRRSARRRVRRARAGVALVVGAGLTLGACTDSGSGDSGSSGSGSSGSGDPATPSTAAPSPEWERIDAALAELAPEVGFLAARVTPDGTCEPVHEVEATTARPIGSQFKLFVLGALADEIAAGRHSWDQTLTVLQEEKSVGNQEGSLQFVDPGTVVTLEEAATLMISISDNTAADLLVDLVGQDAIQARLREWVDDPAANDPFLTTKQMFLLHYATGLADRYLATPPAERAAFLAAEVDPLLIGEIASGYSSAPRYVDTIEWFATPLDLCRTFAGLQQLAEEPALAPLPSVLSKEVIGIGLDRDEWPTLWYKGGSEPGVLTLGWLGVDRDGATYVVEGMLMDPDAVLAEDAITDLRALAEDAFGLLRAG